jgi:ribose 5-phosphate isomerase B
MRSVITERDVPLAGVLKIVKDTIFTPSARDLIRLRGIEIQEVGADAVHAGTPETTIAIGADHGGFAMKEALKPVLQELHLAVIDIGVAAAVTADYPDIARKVAELVAARTAHRGIIVDGAGIGSAMAANKVPGVRAALCYDRASARNSREHNDANVLTLGGRLLTQSQAEEVMRVWLTTPFAGGRHQARIDKIIAIEKAFSK